MKRFFGFIFSVVSLLMICFSVFLTFNIVNRVFEPCPVSRTKAPTKMFCNYELVDKSKWLSERPEWIVTTNIKTPIFILVILVLTSFSTYKIGKYLKKK